MKNWTQLSVAILTSCFISLPAWGATLYRYINDEGVTVLDRTIPPQFVHKGYSILNERGEVIKVVPRALTEEEKAQLREEQQRAAEQAARDAELKRLYRSPDDVDQAMLAWVSRLNVEVNLANGHLTAKRTSLADLQSDAADLERAGKTVTPELIAQIRDVEADIEAGKVKVQEILDRMDADILMFELDKRRVAEISGIPGKPTLEVLRERNMRVPAFLLAE